MLIGHISDTHLGAVPYNIREREEDFYESFNEAIETMVKDRVKLVIHSGDIFDIPRPSGTPLVKFTDSLKKLREREIMFVFTLGEHDISRLYEIPSAFLYPRVELASYIGDGNPREVLEGLTIVGFHKRRRDESDELKEKLSQLDSLLKGYTGKKILVLHQGLYEFHAFAGEIRALDLPKSFDYYAMGHLHDRAEKSFDYLKGKVCYPGSLDVTSSEGIKEFHKGFYMVDISGDEPSTQWIELKTTRKHFSFEVDYERIDGIIHDIIEKIKGLEKKPMLNIMVKGKELDFAKISSSLRVLGEYCLHYQWEVEETSQEVKKYTERPADIEEEMLRLAESITGSREAAILSIKEILPLLAENNTEKASEILWKYFEERRKI
jgi:exonuclease SbcD